jgi:hypothetical protein
MLFGSHDEQLSIVLRINLSDNDLSRAGDAALVSLRSPRG